VLPELLAHEQIPDAPIDPDTLSRDPAVGKAYAEDPLVWHGPFKRPTLEGLSRALETITAAGRLGAVPTLWLHGEDDLLVPIEATRTGVERLKGSDFREKTYPGARHEILNETNAEEVLADVTAFVDEQLSRLAGRGRYAVE
jgi:alpha-beta hydrolase superfamily lysophospholipase